MSETENPLDAYMRAAGLLNRDMAVALGLAPELVRRMRCGMRPIHPNEARLIEEKFGIPRHRLRPDIWDPPPEKPSRGKSGAKRSETV